MSETTLLQLPLIAASQSQKHVTHNEAIRRLDAIVHVAVKDRDLAAPPGGPADGDRYLVAAGATGAWAGEDGKIAAWIDGAWEFFSVRAGWAVWIEDEALLVVFDGATYVSPSLRNAALIGLNTTASASTRLAVASDGVLFSHDAGGSTQVKLNKEAAAGTASLVFQTGFSGRAEFGLAGNDDLKLKVSADGAAFNDALTIDAATGETTIETGNTIIARSANGAALGLHVIEEEVTVAGATTDTTIVIPARAIPFCVSVRTTEAIAGAASFDCGHPGDASMFGGALGIAAGSTNAGVIWPQPFWSDTAIRLTANGGAFTGGKVRVAIHYLMPVVPQG